MVELKAQTICLLRFIRNCFKTGCLVFGEGFSSYRFMVYRTSYIQGESQCVDKILQVDSGNDLEWILSRKFYLKELINSFIFLYIKSV